MQGLQIDDNRSLTIFRQAKFEFCDLALGHAQFEKFDGCCEDGTETPFSNWLEMFNLIVEPFHLSDEEKALVLVSNLTGPAREEILYCLSNEERRSFKDVVKALRLCFSREDSHYLRCLFHNRVQRDDEDLADFSRALMRLYAKLVDVADNETEAAALGQLRDEALSSLFVSGARDVRERFMLRRLSLRNRGGRFEVLRREALVILHDGCMLEGDGLKAAGSVDTGTHAVFTEPVVQPQDLSSDTITMEEREITSTLLEGGSQAAGCVGKCEGGARIDAGKQEHTNMQPQNTHVTQKVRSTPKGGNVTHSDINVNNVMTEDVNCTPRDKWEHGCRVHGVVWGPWESNWRPDCATCFLAAG